MGFENAFYTSKTLFIEHKINIQFIPFVVQIIIAQKLPHFFHLSTVTSFSHVMEWTSGETHFRNEPGNFSNVSWFQSHVELCYQALTNIESKLVAKVTTSAQKSDSNFIVHNSGNMFINVYF